MQSRWDKLLAREFTISILVVVISAVALFLKLATFVEWGAFATTIALGYQGVKAYKEKNATPEPNGNGGA